MFHVELTFKNLLLLIALLVLAWVMYRLRETVLLIGLALMLMATLHPFVVMLRRRGLSHSKAVALVLLGAVLLPLAIIAALSPLVISEVSAFAASFPTLQHHINELLHNWGIADQVNNAIDRLDLQSRIGDLALVGVRQTTTIVVDVFAIVVIGAYLLADSHRLQVVLHEFVPRDSERHIEPLLEGLERVVGGYIRGQILTSAMFGAFAFALCFALGVPDPLLLGIVAAIGDVIPIFGVPAAMVITVVVAFTSSVWQPIGVVIGYIVYGQLESHFIVPRIYGRTVNMSPLVVIIATLAGGALDGFIGVFVAIPVAGAIKVVLDYVVEQRLKGREAAAAKMQREVTDPVGRKQDEIKDHGPQAGEPATAGEGVPAPSYSPFETIPEPESARSATLSGARYVTLSHVRARRPSGSALRHVRRRRDAPAQSPASGAPEQRPPAEDAGRAGRDHVRRAS